MKSLAKKIAVATLIMLSLSSSKIFAQQGNVTLQQDQKFEDMLAEKRKINSSITVNDKYKIQVYNGDSETSKKTLTEFKREFKNHDATIVFSTPSYKVWAGNFKTRIEAERNLAEVKKRFPNAFLVRPNK